MLHKLLFLLQIIKMFMEVVEKNTDIAGILRNEF